MNGFIETFLEITLATLKQMNIELREKRQLLDLAEEKLRSEPQLVSMSKMHRGMMFILAQNHFFDSNSGLTVGELAGIIGKSQATTRKIIKGLLAASPANADPRNIHRYHHIILSNAGFTVNV